MLPESLFGVQSHITPVTLKFSTLMYSCMLDHLVLLLSSVGAQFTFERLHAMYHSYMCVLIIMSIVCLVTMSTMIQMFMWMRSLHVYGQLSSSGSHKIIDLTRSHGISRKWMFSVSLVIGLERPLYLRNPCRYCKTPHHLSTT